MTGGDLESLRIIPCGEFDADADTRCVVGLMVAREDADKSEQGCPGWDYGVSTTLAHTRLEATLARANELPADMFERLAPVLEGHPEAQSALLGAPLALRLCCYGPLPAGWIRMPSGEEIQTTWDEAVEIALEPGTYEVAAQYD